MSGYLIKLNFFNIYKIKVKNWLGTVFVIRIKVLTPTRWPTVTATPIMRGVMALLSGLAASHTPQTTNTKINARKNSTPNPCTGVIPSASFTTPRNSSSLSFERALRIAEPAIAPAHCATTYKMPLIIGTCELESC